MQSFCFFYDKSLLYRAASVQPWDVRFYKKESERHNGRAFFFVYTGWPLQPAGCWLGST